MVTSSFTDILQQRVCLARHQLHPNSVVHEDSRSKWPPATSLVDFVSTQALPLGPERFLRDWTMAGSNVFGINCLSKNQESNINKETLSLYNQRDGIEELKDPTTSIIPTKITKKRPTGQFIIPGNQISCVLCSQQTFASHYG